MYVHFEQRVGEDVSKATRVKAAVRFPVVLEVIDLRELKASVLQQLITVELLVGHVNLLGRDLKQSGEVSVTFLMLVKRLLCSLSLLKANAYLQKAQTFSNKPECTSNFNSNPFQFHNLPHFSPDVCGGSVAAVTSASFTAVHNMSK